jgi:1,2-diacylglycerol 3-alpha-glucosyltransferase
MKILITTDWYKPVINGVVTSVENLRTGLLAAGHEVKILTLSGTRRNRIDGDTYYVGSLSAGLIYPNARIMLAYEVPIIRGLIKWKPDIVHSQCEFSTFFLAHAVATRCGAPLVHTYHTAYEDYTHYFIPSRKLGKKLSALVSRRIIAATQAVIVPSGKIADMLEGYGVKKPINVIPSGLSMDQFMKDDPALRAGLREKFGIGEDECVLLYLGRLAKEKNVEELLWMLKNDCREDQRMLIVGGGPYERELRSMAAELGLEGRIIFTGMVPADEVAGYYSAVDVFVNASDSETQGLTYMEAMASGLPVICKDDDCLRDVVVHGENGYIYKDEEDFAAILEELRGSAELRARVGAAARKTVLEQFSLERFAESCVAVYEKCLAEGR